MKTYIVLVDGIEARVSADRVEVTFDSGGNCCSFRFWQGDETAAFFPFGRVSGYWFSGK